MKETTNQRGDFSEELKEEAVLLVLHKKRSPNAVAKLYKLPNVHILLNWIILYKKKLENYEITFPGQEREDPFKNVVQRLRALEKEIERADYLIRRLNLIIESAEANFIAPLPKKKPKA